MYNRNFRNGPFPFIFIAMVVLFALGFGSFVFSMIEALFPLLVLIAIVAIVARITIGADQTSQAQQMIRNMFGFTDQQPGPRRQSWNDQPPPFVHENPENAKRRNIADKAVSRAGYRAGDNPDIDLADIGLLVYEGNVDPKICRLSDVPTNASHIRPFIVLDLPNLPDTGGNGVIRFNLIDGSGKLRYTSRSRYTVKRGQNFITPKTWLPLANQAVGNDWSLQVCVGEGTPFAIHEFEWLKIGGEIRAHFTGDGEIDELMQPAISQSIEDPISLDELLADQGQEAPLVMNARR